MQYLRNLFNATAHCDSNYLFIPLAVIAKMLFPALPAPLSCLLLCNNRCFISLYASSIDQANGFVLPTAYPAPFPYPLPTNLYFPTLRNPRIRSLTRV